MIKIAFVSPGKLPQPAIKGGAVEGLIDLLVDSLKVEDNKYEVHVYSVDERDENTVIENVNYHYIKNTGVLNQISRKTRGIINILSKNLYIGNNYINKVAQRIKEQRITFDIVIVQNVPEYGIILKKYNVAKHYILHMHNNNFNNGSKNAKEIFNIYEEIYTISNTVKQYICSINNSDKVKVLYNGVDQSIFGKRISAGERQSERSKLNFRSNDVVFVFAGRLTQEKGVKELILAFRQLVQKNKNAKLMIIGSSFFDGAKDTEYVTELKKIAETIKNNIVFTGFIKHENLYKWYQLGDVGVVPSQWDEPFALTVIEEMMCGLPMVASKCGGIVEITQEDCAILIEQNSEYVNNLVKVMKDLLDDPIRREAMSNNAVEQAGKFDSRRYCCTFKKYIDNVTNMDQRKREKDVKEQFI